MRSPFVQRVIAMSLVLTFAFTFLSPTLHPPQHAHAVSLSNISGTVNSATLNLRASPGGTIVRSLPYGTNLTIIGTNGDWFKVQAGGRTGYVSSWYVALKGVPSRVISRGNTSRKMVALTFDAGSDLGYTELILNTLADYGIRASFGLTGDWILANPGYAAWIAANGHLLINHSTSHPSFTGASAGSGPISPARRLSQLRTTENRMSTYAGFGSKPYWRPPYGDYDASVLRDSGAGGYGYTVMWSIDTLGWNGVSQSSIYSKVMNNVGNGSIILMHLGSGSFDGPALSRILDGLISRGYRFGTVAEVIS